jgi:hypothetical protein
VARVGSMHLGASDDGGSDRELLPWTKVGDNSLGIGLGLRQASVGL